MATIFVNLTQQLENFRKFGPPKLRKPMMTLEEMKFAQKYTNWGIENFGPVVDEFYTQLEVEEVPPLFSSEDRREESLFSKEVSDNGSVRLLDCSACGVELSEEAVATVGIIEAALSSKSANDEELTGLKHLQKAVQEGLSIDYRCPNCRSCSDCRRSFETERVSLREEAEDLMIWESVVIDWEKKQIICHLPLLK